MKKVRKSLKGKVSGGRGARSEGGTNEKVKSSIEDLESLFGNSGHQTFEV